MEPWPWNKRNSFFFPQRAEGGQREPGRERSSLSWCLHSLSQDQHGRSRSVYGADSVSPTNVSCLTQTLTIAPRAQLFFFLRATNCMRSLNRGLVLTQTQPHVAIATGKLATSDRFPRHTVWCWHSSMVYCFYFTYRAHQYTEGTNLPGEVLQFMSKVLFSS